MPLPGLPLNYPARSGPIVAQSTRMSVLPEKVRVLRRPRALDDPQHDNIWTKTRRLIGRFALHDDRTLFLFVFAADAAPSPAMLDLAAQKAMLRERFGAGKWECPHILGELDRVNDLY